MERKAIRQTATPSALAPRISAVVVVVAGDGALELCLRAALADPWVDELVIVDAGAPPGVASSLRGLAADRRDVRLVPAPGVGLWRARNLGAARAAGRWLLFLEPTVVVRRGAGARLVAAGRSSVSPWLVGGRLKDPSGEERPSLRRSVPTAWSALWGGGGLVRGPRRPDAPARAGAVDDGMVLIPRDDFTALGGYPADAGETMATLELCRRVGRAGGVVRFAPRAEGVEFVAGGQRRDRAEREADGIARYVLDRAGSPAERAFARLTQPLLKAMIRFRMRAPRSTRG